MISTSSPAQHRRQHHYQHRIQRHHHHLDPLGDGLQLADLLVEVRQVLLDDVRQLLDLHRLVVENRLPPENME